MFTNGFTLCKQDYRRSIFIYIWIDRYQLKYMQLYIIFKDFHYINVCI